MIADPVKRQETVEITRHRFTVDEFMRMAELGLLGEQDRLELLWGEIVEMSPINVAHASTVNRLVQLLTKKLGEKVILSIQNPLQLDQESLPQPDIAILRLREDFYSKHHPGPEAVWLLIEVADASVPYDRKTKNLLYASAGIVEYWIVNLPARQIEVYREPQPDGYRMIIRHTAGESVSCLAFPEIALEVDDIIGPPSE